MDGIEASMPRSTATAMPHEPAIGSDPFAEQDESGRRRIIVLGIVLIIVLCGLGVFLLPVLSNP